jgi:hypothetical protein
LKLLAAGNYIVTARLVSTEPDSPEMGTVRQRQKLIEARKVAPEKWDSRIDRVIARIDQPQQDVAQIRLELKQMLDDKPTGQLASLLDTAWRLLN